MVHIQRFQRSSPVRVQQLTTLHSKLRPRQLLLLAGIMALLLPAAAHAASAGNGSKGVIQTINGVIPGSANKDTKSLTIKSTDIVAGASQTPLISIVSSGRSGLDTGKLEIRKSGEQANLAEIARNDIPGNNNSFTLFKATLNQQYRLTLNAQKGTHGTYSHSVRLSGDVDNNGKVDTADIAAIKRNMGKQSAIIPLMGDVDRNGRVNDADLKLATQNVGAYIGQQTTNPLDDILPEGALTLSGVDPGVINDRGSELKFTLNPGMFATDPVLTSVKVNNSLVNAANVSVAGNIVTVKNALQDGKNVIAFAGSDQLGRTIFHTATVWAGKGSLGVQLRNADGTPRRLNPTVAEKEALVAFLRTLTDNAIGTDEKFGDPFK